MDGPAKCVVLLPIILSATTLAPQPVSSLPKELHPLIQELKDKGFTIRVELPPLRGVYGLYRSGIKTLWVSPVTIPLGIARQTFLHEAVHAVQSCPDGVLSPIGWNAQVAPIVEREISAILLKKYRARTRVLEREAFFIQGQRNGPMLILNELRKRC